MRTFGKSSKLDNVLYDVRGPVVDEAARMEEDGMEILKLNIGNPYPFGFSAPQEVILDMLSITVQPCLITLCLKTQNVPSLSTPMAKNCR